jgi:hypothetical protein
VQKAAKSMNAPAITGADIQILSHINIPPYRNYVHITLLDVLNSGHLKAVKENARKGVWKYVTAN